MRHRRLLLGIFVITTVGLMVGAIGMFVLPNSVPSTNVTSLETPQSSETPEMAETPESAREGASQPDSRANSRVSSEVPLQATMPTTARTEQMDGKELNKQPAMLLYDYDQTLPFAQVPLETIPQVTSAEEVPLKTVSLHEKIEQPVDIEDIPEPELPLWRLNAVILPEIPTGPQIVVVIDDAGVDRRRTRQVIGLPGPLTIAFLTYARQLDKQVKLAAAKGHEIMTHVPMQPINADADPGKNALNTDLHPNEVKSRLLWALNRIPGHVGINNHMGSRYTSHEKGMQLVMAELRTRGLLFLDSRTSRNTVGAKLAKIYQVPHVVRNIFLDHDPKLESIKKQLAELEKVAQKKGYAVAIGHPRDATIEALSQWLPILAEKGLVLVPISAIIARREGIPQTRVKLSKN